MQTGKIQGLNNGYGFIEIEGQEKNLFFHLEDLQNVSFDELQMGDTLEFEVGEGNKGPKAVNVSRV